MGKLIGAFLILAGCGGLVASWQCTQKKRQAVAAGFIRLLERWEYSLEKERMGLCDFLAQTKDLQDGVENFTVCLLDSLTALEYASGRKAWRQALAVNRAQLLLDGDMWEILWSADGVFFGASARECLCCAAACRRRLDGYLTRARTEFWRRQKVFVPVGMLGGVLLIILLI